MSKQQENTSLAIKAIKAGILIGLGCIAYITVENKYIGAGLFSLGLLGILTQELKLYTGVIGFLGRKEDIIPGLIILGGNLLGIGALGLISSGLVPSCSSLIYGKLGKSFFEVLFSSWACGILMYTAVMGYRKGYPIIVVISIMFFILCGFDHCIANYFYMTNSGILFDWRLPVMIFGNSLGSWTLSKFLPSPT